MLNPGMPEAELLFSVVQSAGSSDEQASQIDDDISGELDWSKVFNLSRRHGLLCQLYRVCESSRLEPPGGVKQQLKQRFRENTVKNLQYAQQLHKLLNTFEEHDIRAIPYKGPTLAEFAYGGLNGRWFGDLDLLVAEDDILYARNVLLEMGFEQANAVGIDPSSLVKSSVFRWENEFRFVQDSTMIELRYRFAGGTPSESNVFENLWNARVSIPVAGRTVQALSPEDRVLLLLRHGTKHGWLRLSWVYDAAAAIQQGVDWDEVIARAKMYGWATAVLVGVGVVAELSNIEVPRRIRQEVMESHRANWGSSFLTTLFRSDPTGASHDLDPLTVVLFLNDSRGRSLRELFSVLFSPSIATYDMFPLRSELYPLYYFLRPIELGKKALD